MGPTIKIIRKSEIWQKLENLAYSENLSIRRAPREANNFGIFTLTIRLSSNFVKIHTSGVNRINIWVPGPGETAKNSKRHGLRFWTSADFVILYIICLYYVPVFSYIPGSAAWRSLLIKYSMMHTFY